MSKDIITAALNEDYSTVKDIFESKLSEKISNTLDERKILIQKVLYEFKWFSNLDKLSKIGNITNIVGAAFAIGGALVMIPKALAGMKQARRFAKVGPNLKSIEKWFPSAKPGDTILMSFEEEGEGGMPSWQHIKYEQIAVVMAALGSNTVQPSEKEMIVKSIDLTKSAFDQITQISMEVVARDKDFSKLAAHQNTKVIDTPTDTQFENLELYEAGKGTDWESWSTNAKEIFSAGEKAASETGKVVDSQIEKLEKEKEDKEKERQAEVQGLINQLNDESIDNEERVKVVNKLKNIKKPGDYNIDLALQQSTGRVRSATQASQNAESQKKKAAADAKKAEEDKDIQNEVAAHIAILNGGTEYSVKDRKDSANFIKNYLKTEVGRKDYATGNIIKNYENIEAPINAAIDDIHEFAKGKSNQGNPPPGIPKELIRSEYSSGGAWLPVKSKRKDSALGWLNRSGAKVLSAWLNENNRNVENFKQAFGSLTDLGHLLRAATARSSRLTYTPILLNKNFENQDNW